MIGRDKEVNQMSNIMQMIERYNRYGLIRKVAKELNISRNTVKEYIKRSQSVNQGIEKEIIPEDCQT
jgi:orotate phosphoribosyltransferase-like protein